MSIDKNSFGKALKEYHKPFSQRQLAALIGVARTTVTMWENGKRLPIPGYVVKVIAAMGHSAELNQELISSWIESFRELHPLTRKQMLNQYDRKEPITDDELRELF